MVDQVGSSKRSSTHQVNKRGESVSFGLGLSGGIFSVSRKMSTRGLAQVYETGRSKLAEDIVTLSLHDLGRETGLGLKEAHSWFMSACQIMSPPMVPCSLLLHSQKYLKTGIKELDDALNGGLPSGMLVEVFGESGGNHFYRNEHIFTDISSW